MAIALTDPAFLGSRSSQPLRRLLSLGAIAAGLLLLSASPVAALVPLPRPASAPTAPTTTAAPTVAAPPWLTQAQALYTAGRLTEALELLSTGLAQTPANTVVYGIGLSNRALVHQALGHLPQARQDSQASVQLLEGQPDLNLRAQSRAIAATVLLAMGEAQAALEDWTAVEHLYRQLGNPLGQIQAQLSQAQALQVLGFYEKSLQRLVALNQTLQAQPDTLLKAIALRSLGDAQQLKGDFAAAQASFTQSRQLAQVLQSPREQAATLISWGNLAAAQGQTAAAIAHYQTAAHLAPELGLQAQLNQLRVQRQDGPAVQQLWQALRPQLQALPASQESIYAQIQLATYATQLPPLEVAELLANAVQQARSLGNPRLEAEALGSLGALYAQQRQWPDAQKLTQQAIARIQDRQVPEVSYQLDWQLGRIFKQQGNRSAAIAAYERAIAALQLLRSDLVSGSQDAQFSFREGVEPIYREAVDLLLRDAVDPAQIDLARQHMESLQLAELDNFFREACINTQKVVLDTIVDRDNPTAAIIYPVILADRIEVIVKIPQQPLRHHSVAIDQKTAEAAIAQLQAALPDPDGDEVIKTEAQKLHQWLIQPLQADLAQHPEVKTLVFVLDGPLRSVPMAVLYNAQTQKYLIEDYALSLSLGLQLQAPKPLHQTPLHVLAAGLITPPQDFQYLASLPGITAEFSNIQASGVPTHQLLEQQFTKVALETQLNGTGFNVVHLATHGEFSSKAENTFILAASGKIGVKEIDSLLRGQTSTRPEAIELLVLSACRTAAGDKRATLGLAGVTVKAGARSTLASLWHVDDSATAELIGEFYKGLQAKPSITKAEALQRAQTVLLRSPNYRDARFWAPFVLVGNWL